MKIALVSLDQLWEQKEGNLTRCRDAATRAAARGAELVVFPEMTLTGFSMNATVIAEDPQTSTTIAAFLQLARELGTTIAFGVVLRTPGGRPSNCLVVAGSDGRELARYAKVHPFSHATEHEFYDAGDRIWSARIGDVTFGLSVCYDLRFPELYTALAPACDAMIVIANWPGRRIEHWDVLLRARAIDCQCYVIGVNRTGVDGNGIEYPRSSYLIDPRGEAVAPTAVDGDVSVFTLDATAVADYRRRFPTLQDRRSDLYRSWLA